MARFFHSSRVQAIRMRKVLNYVLYALGEIALVVAGILIALQVDNSNEARKERAVEVRHLNNLRKDLLLNISEINKYVTERSRCIQNAQEILEYFGGKPITDVKAFNELGMPIYNWQRFYQINNTYLELTNSGGLGIISSDSIKTMLFQLESIYRVNKAEEDHYRFDSESCFYLPLYESVDLEKMFGMVGYSVNKEPRSYTMGQAFSERFIKDTKLKNGFVLTIAELSLLNEQLNEMKRISERLIKVIDRENSK